MTGDKQSDFADGGGSEQDSGSWRGNMSNRERWKDKDSEGSEGNMRRKRRLETFQPVFPALVIKV